MMRRLCSLLYGGLVELRNRGFDCGLVSSRAVSCPVVSVGNITAGGNAKTPLVMRIVAGLVERGYSPFVITRGYGGRERGPHLVTSVDSSARVGDEPRLLWQRTKRPVVVARRRVEGARFALQKQLGDVAILDDGLQHRWIARDLEIVSVNVGSEAARAEFLKGKLLPEGLFRESRAGALRRTDLLVFAERRMLSAGTPLDPKLREVVPHSVRVFRSSLRVEGLVDLSSGSEGRVSQGVAFCGIADPGAFFETLESSGIKLSGRESFADHFEFRGQDFQRLRQLAAGQALICTEKDAERIPEAERKGVFMLKTSTVVEPEQEFFDLVVSAIEKRRQELRN